MNIQPVELTFGEEMPSRDAKWAKIERRTGGVAVADGGPFAGRAVDKACP
jgi:hypothetical protein